MALTFGMENGAEAPWGPVSEPTPIHITCLSRKTTEYEAGNPQVVKILRLERDGIVRDLSGACRREAPDRFPAFHVGGGKGDQRA